MEMASLECGRTNFLAVTFKVEQFNLPPFAETFQLMSFAVARDDVS